MVFRVTDGERPGSQFGAWWTPVDPKIYEASGICGPDYCGIMELLALPPFHTDGSVNPYNIVLVGVVDIEDIEFAGFVRSEQWVDGTRAGGGGVEFYIPGGCEPRGPVRNCMVHRHAFDYLPIWP